MFYEQKSPMNCNSFYVFIFYFFQNRYVREYQGFMLLKTISQNGQKQLNLYDSVERS